jgi:hypothetical protein
VDSRTTRVAQANNNVPATTATIAAIVTTYPITRPAIASPRPSSPVRLICDRDKWPNTIPSGANTNAHTSDAIAMALVGDGGGG